MKTLYRYIFTIVLMSGLWLLDMAPEAPYLPVFVGNAEAVVGRPLTPVSVGGVARRTTRRAVVATSSSTSAAEQQAAASQQQAAAAEQEAAEAQQQAAAAQQQAAGSKLPAGTVVTALPSGCESMTVDGTSLFNCGGVVYQPSFQSNNLVYIVK